MTSSKPEKVEPKQSVTKELVLQPARNDENKENSQEGGEEDVYLEYIERHLDMVDMLG